MSETTIHEHYDAYVVLGGGLTPEEDLPKPVERRVDTGIAALEQDPGASMLMTGKHTFMLDTPPATTEAREMLLYAWRRGVDPRIVSGEHQSLDTVGNAVFTKQDFVVPRGWDRIAVVTSTYHLQRALRIFRHVMGPDIVVDGIGSPEPTSLRTKAAALVGSMTMGAILHGTEPGDDEAIQERMFDLVPGYTEDSKATKLRFATHSLLGAAGIHMPLARGHNA